MLGELNEAQIESLLNELPVGRIGCHSDGITYIVPVNYAYAVNARRKRTAIARLYK